MGTQPRCFCGRPTQNTGSAFICALAKCPFRVSTTASPVQPPQSASEKCTVHGTPVELVTQRPMGHLPGRRYVRCAHPVPHRCAYFRILQNVPADPQPRQGFVAEVRPTRGNFITRSPPVQQSSLKAANFGAGPGGFAPRETSHSTPSQEHQTSSPSCHCGVAAKERTVRKEGANKGKQFFVCGKPMGEQCGYFEWASQISANSGSARYGVAGSSIVQQAQGNRGPFTSRHSNGVEENDRPRLDTPIQAHMGNHYDESETEAHEEDDAPNCVCGDVAIRRTVKKSGPNHGKDFFVCAKAKDEQCRFFEWAKSRPAAPSGIPGKRADERPYSASSSGSAKRPRFSPRGKIVLELDEIDTFSFMLHMTMPSDLREAVKKFSGAKIKKTEMLGVEKVLIPIAERSRLEQYLISSAGTKVDCNIPDKILKRIIEYLAAEKRREESGDVVKQSLEELLPSLVCEKLMQFQWHGVHFALKRGGRCLIGDDMGLGKTLQAIAVARIYSSDWPLLIICPSSLRLNWKEEILNWLEDDVFEEDILVMMTGKDVDRPLQRITIVSYDLIRKVPQRSLRQVGFVIADESHYLKSGSALRSKAVIPLVHKARRALLLSGTPALSRPVELFPQVNAISPSLFPSFREFVERYCAAHHGFFGYDTSGASNLRELHTLLRGSVLIRRKKEEVLTQLPDKQRQVLWVQIKPQSRKKVAAAMAELESAKSAVSEADPGGRGLSLQNAVNAAQTQLYKLTGQVKIEGILEVCKDTADAGCKFIVFAHHAQVLEALDTYAKKKLKLEIIRIDGKTPQAKRQALCKRFQTDPGCRIALLSITAAGVGLTLTEAKVVLFAELYWNPGSLLQAEDRAHRIGQKDSVLVKYLLARNTIDESMWSTVRRKLNVVGHSLTGAAARMVVNDEGMQSKHQKKGGIERFFSRKSQDRNCRTQSQETVNTGEELDSIIEVVDDDSMPAATAPTNPRPPQIEAPASTSPALPTTLRDLSFPLDSYSKGCQEQQFSDLPDSIDLGESLRAQEQMDRDVALARKLQAQFDAEEQRNGERM